MFAALKQRKKTAVIIAEEHSWITSHCLKIKLQSRTLWENLENQVKRNLAPFHSKVSIL